MAEKLRFQCDVGWRNMTPLPGGRRHCGRCDHAVHDLTRFTHREALAFRKSHPDACIHVMADAETGELVFASERRRLPVHGAAIAAMLTLGCGDDPASSEASLAPPTVEALVERGTAHVAADEQPAEAAHPVADETREAEPDETPSASEFDALPQDASSGEAPPEDVAARPPRRHRAAAAGDEAQPSTMGRRLVEVDGFVF